MMVVMMAKEMEMVRLDCGDDGRGWLWHFVGKDGGRAAIGGMALCLDHHLMINCTFVGALV